ncbi:hypothetical protein Tco_1237741 [Tanacetum coccineum]
MLTQSAVPIFMCRILKVVTLKFCPGNLNKDMRRTFVKQLVNLMMFNKCFNGMIPDEIRIESLGTDFY